MTPEVLNQALDPFFTTKEVGQGTGLGLPMVFGIVQGHQGYLTIDTRAGQGTAVGLYLPRLIESARRRRRPQAAARARRWLEPETVPGRHILVIDDEEAVLDVVRRFLRDRRPPGDVRHERPRGLELLATGQSRRPGDPRPDDAARGRSADVPAASPAPRRMCRCCCVPGCRRPTRRRHCLRQTAWSLMRKPFRMNELWYAVKQALTE